jgi:hypothetical protein
MVGWRDWRRQSNCPTAAAARGKKKYDDVPATQISGILFIAYPPSLVAGCFPLPVAHNLVFGGGGFLFFFPIVDQKVPSHHRPLVDKSIGPRRR